MKLNSEQISELIRLLLGIALGPGSYLIAKGILTPDQANQIIPILVPVVMTASAAIIGKFSISANSASALVASVNSPSVPGVKAVAEGSPSPAVQVTSTGAVKTIVPPAAAVAEKAGT